MTNVDVSTKLCVELRFRIHLSDGLEPNPLHQPDANARSVSLGRGASDHRVTLFGVGIIASIIRFTLISLLATRQP